MNNMKTVLKQPKKNIKRFLWVFKIAFQYFKFNKTKGYKTINRFNVISLAIGVMAIITTVAVLNGLQQGYISTIIEVGSSHLRVVSRGELDDDTLKSIKKNKYVLSILPKTESQTLARGGFNEYLNIVVKGLPFESITEDKLFIKKLNLIEGSYPKANNEILLGEILAINLALDVGDELSLVGFSKNRLGAFEEKFVVSGIFKTNFYDYDSMRAFMPLVSAVQTISNEKEIFYEIKLTNSFLDSKVKKMLAKLNLDVDVWRNYNKSFFTALKLEKNVMLFLLSLIFIVVSLNIYQGRLMDIEQKRNEIAILKAMGATSLDLKVIFVIQGFLISTLGSSIGLVLGLTVSYNINFILNTIENFANFFLIMLNLDTIAILSGSDFYLENGIPIKLYKAETFYIYLFAVISPMLASYLASFRLAKLNVVEILSNE